MRVREFCSFRPSLANGVRAGGRWGVGGCSGQPSVVSSRHDDRMCIGNGSRDAGARFREQARSNRSWWQRGMPPQSSFVYHHRGMSDRPRRDQIRRGLEFSGEDRRCRSASIGTMSFSCDHKIFRFLAQEVFWDSQEGDRNYSKCAGRCESSVWQTESSRMTQQGRGLLWVFWHKPSGG